MGKKILDIQENRVRLMHLYRRFFVYWIINKKSRLNSNSMVCEKIWPKTDGL